MEKVVRRSWPSNSKAPKELEKENARINKLVAEQALNMLKGINRGKW